jgi:hypothetical protein
LLLYKRIGDPYSIGRAHLELSRVTKSTEPNQHRHAARDAWLSIGREDLVKKHDLSK